jgi:hypothetical protein
VHDFARRRWPDRPSAVVDPRALLNWDDGSAPVAAAMSKALVSTVTLLNIHTFY